MPVSVRRFRLFSVSIGQAFLWALLLSLALLLIAPPVSDAQVVTNITPTTSAPLDLGTNVDTVGSTTEITGGTRPGSGTNLFHSFDAFTLGTGDTAHFLNDMQLPTTNIIGRVIGGEVSTIDGTLRTNNPLNAADPMNFGAANLWLVNPSGLFLGPNARIEVGGSVSMSTANYLRFETSTLFDMLSSPASLGPLSVAPVAAFGFLGSNPGDITVQGSQISVTDGQSISFVGGNTFIESGTPQGGTPQPVQLSAPNGKIQLATAASPGEFDAATLQPLPNADGASFTSIGSVSLAPGSTINVSGTSTVFIKGGKIVVSVNDGVLTTSQTPGPPETISLSPGSSIVTSNSGTDSGADIQLIASHIKMDEASIFSTTAGAGAGEGGTVRLDVGDLQVLNGSQIGTFTRGSGNGGPIDVRANSLLISGVDLSDEAPSSLLSSAIGTAASGTAGDIRVQADSVVVQNGGQIRADLVGGSPGNAGNIDITAGTVDISNRGLIAAAVVEGTGPAGRVDITANDVRIIGDGTVDPLSAWLGSNRGFDFPTDLPPPPEWFDATGITTSTNAGRGGELTLKADTLAITDNGAITSRTIGSGDAGTIDLHIANNVTLMKGGIVSASTSGTGVGGNISVATDTLMLSDGGILSASTFGVVPEAAAGTIRVDATTVSLTGGSQIASDSFGPGGGGAIHITASDLVTLTGTSADGLTPTLVVTNAQATGNLSDIVVMTKNLTASGGAHVRTESLGSRAAGSIHVKATETVSLAGESADGVFASGLYANTVSSAPDAGDGGSITVEAKNLTIGEGGAQIASGSFGFGDGGTINVTVAEALTIAGTSADGVFASGLFANTEGSMPGSGKGGNIFVATKYLSAEGGGQISTISLGSGTGGDIRVTATQRLMLNGRSPDGSWPSGLVANAESGASDAGDAGNIVVEAKELIIEGGAGITSTSLGPGAGGAIQVTATEAVTLTGVGISGDTVFASGLSTASVSETPGAGDAGNLVLVTKNLTLEEGAQITSDSFGPGAGGSLRITADENMVVTGRGPDGVGSSLVASSLGTAPGSGGAGTIVIAATDLILDRGVIETSTQGPGNAGNITANVGTLITSGPFSGIFSSSNLTNSTAGNAGSITIQGITGSGSPAVNVSLDDSTISTQIFGGSAATTPSTITITAHTLALANDAHIGAETFGAAPAGDITLNVDTLTAGGGFSEGFPGINSVITSRSVSTDLAAGNAGSITIQGIDGLGSSATSVSLDSSTINTQIAGGSVTTTPSTITITAHTLILANQANILAHTLGAAPAGDITLNVGTLTVGFSSGVFSDSAIFTDPTAGNAGNITIQGVTGSGSPAADVRLDNSTISTMIWGGGTASTPATITITAHTLALAGGVIEADTNGAAPAGDITLNVGTLRVGGSSITSSSSPFDSLDSGTGNAGSITIQGVTGSGSPAADVRLDNSTISTTIGGGGTASTPATITITARTLALANEALIGADTEGAAPAGDITLNVGTLRVGGSSITSSSSPFDSLDSGTGNAGSITIQGVTGSGSPAADVRLDNSTISTTIGGGGTASTPATITITAHTLILANQANILAHTLGAAPAGDITLNVGTLTVGFSSGVFSDSAIFTDPTAGNAGNITIQGVTGSGSPAADVRLDNSTISTMIWGGGTASTPATITITAHTLALAGGVIEADTNGAAPAGDITLNVGTLRVGGSSITSSSSPFDSLDSGTGNAGSITIQGVTGSGSPAADARLDNSTIRTTITGGTSSSAPANIMIAAQAVTLSNGGAITASTSGNAPAGNIGLVTQQMTMTPDSAITSNAQDGGATTGKAGSITITGPGSAPTTIAGGTIQAQSETSASAGNIMLQAPGDLTLLGTTVSVKNTGPGNAGSISLLAGNDLLVRNSQVSTESAEASGGNIKLTAPNLIHIVDSTINSSVQGQVGSNGGNITIDPQFVVIQNSQLLANANAGAGGNITITATGAVLVDPNSRIDASAGPAGISGSVNINSPIQVLGGTLVPLNQAYSQASLSVDRCAADPTGQFSSFIQTGREGVPQIPGALSPSPLSFLETLTSGSLGSPSPNWAAARLGLDSVSNPSLFRFPSACRS